MGLQHPGSEHACAQELGGTWTRLAKSPCEPGQGNQDSVPALGCLPAPGRTGPHGLVCPTNTRGAQTGGEQEVCIVPQSTSVPNSGDALQGSQRAAVSLLPKC